MLFDPWLKTDFDVVDADEDTQSRFIDYELNDAPWNYDSAVVTKDETGDALITVRVPVNDEDFETNFDLSKDKHGEPLPINWLDFRKLIQRDMEIMISPAGTYRPNIKWDFDIYNNSNHFVFCVLCGWEISDRLGDKAGKNCLGMPEHLPKSLIKELNDNDFSYITLPYELQRKYGITAIMFDDCEHNNVVDVTVDLPTLTNYSPELETVGVKEYGLGFSTSYNYDKDNNTFVETTDGSKINHPQFCDVICYPMPYERLPNIEQICQDIRKVTNIEQLLNDPRFQWEL